ncbi:MAG: efflux RND transporter periplasmic adaptor subunit [Candidatus Polarisedimenticolia bacterium]
MLAGRKRILIPVALGVIVAGGVALWLSRSGGSKAKSDPGIATVAAGTDGVAHASTGAADAKDADPNAKDKKAPVPVSVAAAVSGSVSSYISTTTNLISENDVKVLAESEGRVTELKVEEGDQVARGAVLAVLDRGAAEIAVRKGEVKLANARLVMDRAEKALAEELLSREAFDKLKLDLDIAQQELAEAQWRLDRTVIRAPFGGRVTQRAIRLGQHIRMADHLFSVADFDPLIALIYLPEKDVLGLHEGREVRITLKASDTTQFQGRIRQISPVVDTATGTVKITVEATRPPAEVRPGAFVTIDIVRETRAHAVLVPRLAVVRELQEAHVFVAKGEVAEKRAISVGMEEGEQIEAITGLQPGEQVIVAGQGGLKDGSAIKIIPTTEASDLTISSHRPTHG